MWYSENGISVFYERQEGEKTPVLLLHGWGCDVRTMRRIFYFLACLGHEVVSVDFPGFGKSQEPTADFTVFDYADLTERLIKTLFSRPPVVLGHSFGGRVAIILGSRGIVSELILVSSAGIKPKRKLSYYYKVAKYKFIKKVFKRESKNAGSSDYRRLSSQMKRVFVSVVNTHLESYARQIKVKTTLIWGKNDRQTPLYMAKRLNALIENSALKVMKNCGHFCFLDDFLSFSEILKNSL